MTRTRKPADYLRELNINAVNAGIDSITIPIDISIQIVDRFDNVDALLFNARNTLNQAIYVEVKK